MPSVSVLIGADASSFNRTAEAVARKSREVGQKLTNTGAGLASNPNAFFREALSEKKEPKGLSRKERIAREAAEAKRLDAIEKDNARSWMAQQRDQMAMFRAAEATKRAERKRTDKESADDHRRFVDQQKRGLRESAAVNREFARSQKTTALGGATKMFAGFMTADFLLSQTKQTIEYAAQVDRLSKSLNMSAEDVQAWDKVAQKHGLTLDHVGALLKSINKNRMNVLNGNEPLLVGAAQTLGLSDEMLKSGTSGDIALQIGKAFEKGENIEALTAALMRFGEESAFAFNTAFQDGIASSIEEVKAKGDVMSNEIITRLKLIGEQWMGMGSKLATGFGMILSPILRLVTDVVETLMAIPASISAFVGAASVDTFTHPLEALKAGGKAFLDVWKEDKRRFDERDKKVAEASKPFTPKPFNLEKNEDKERKKKEDAEKKLDDQARRQQEREMNEAAKMGQHSVSSIQQMGGFLGNFAAAAGPEASAMTAQIRSEQHLAEIKKLLSRNNGGGAAQSDVEF